VWEEGCRDGSSGFSLVQKQAGANGTIRKGSQILNTWAVGFLQGDSFEGDTELIM
jgi:hypothetical protein